MYKQNKIYKAIHFNENEGRRENVLNFSFCSAFPFFVLFECEKR